MLVKVSAAQLSDGEKITLAVLRDVWAVDVETGAQLHRSRGRSKAGNAPLWWVSMPSKPEIINTEGLDWFTKKFRASALEDAINKANTLLSELVKMRSRHAEAMS